MADSKKIAITWIELALLILTVIAGMGIWIYVKQKVDLWQKANEPLEATYQKQDDVPGKQAKHSFAQSELTTLQSKLIQEQIDELRKRYLVENLTNAPKTETPGTASPPPASSPTISAELEKAKTDLELTKRVTETLSSQQDEKVKAAAQAYVDLEAAKLRASANFAQAQVDFLRHKRLVALRYAAIAIIALLLLVWILVSVIGIAGRFETRRTVVVGSAAALLFILIGYEAFELGGAALIGILVVITILALLPATKNPQQT
jgi:hypothetical protein